MKRYFLLILCLVTLLYAKESVNLGKWDVKGFETLLKVKDINKISSAFLGVPYEANTLIGSDKSDEVFVVNLSGMDCFTYLDYIESMRKSDSYKKFLSNLKSVRYKDSKVKYKNRRHFFSDWVGTNVEDITSNIGGFDTKRVHKFLNKKDDKNLYLNGIDIVERDIFYIPPILITNSMLLKMKSGDYVGIYTNMNGLDVTHVGIFIRKNNGQLIFRHASSSSKNRAVVDSDFLRYIRSKEGIVIYRPSS